MLLLSIRFLERTSPQKLAMLIRLALMPHVAAHVGFVATALPSAEKATVLRTAMRRHNAVPTPKVALKLGPLNVCCSKFGYVFVPKDVEY